MTEFDYEEDYYDDGGEPTPRAFCDQYVAHPAHVYVAINHNLYDCPGMTTQELADLEAYCASVGTCEHGMSADLCYGPSHYATDEEIARGF